MQSEEINRLMKQVQESVLEASSSVATKSNMLKLTKMVDDLRFSYLEKQREVEVLRFEKETLEEARRNETTIMSEKMEQIQQ
jgi:hypothetical protein